MITKLECCALSVENMEKVKDFILSQLEDKKYKVFNSIFDAIEYTKKEDCKDEIFVIIEKEDELFTLDNSNGYTIYTFDKTDIGFNNYISSKRHLYTIHPNCIEISDSLVFNNVIFGEDNVYHFKHYENDKENEITIYDIIGTSSMSRLVTKQLAVLDIDKLELIK